MTAPRPVAVRPSRWADIYVVGPEGAKQLPKFNGLEWRTRKKRRLISLKKIRVRRTFSRAVFWMKETQNEKSPEGLHPAPTTKWKITP